MIRKKSGREENVKEDCFVYTVFILVQDNEPRYIGFRKKPFIYLRENSFRAPCEKGAAPKTRQG